MISSWCIYRARRMDAQMCCQDARIMIKEKMTTNNLWYCHPSSLVKYLPALREVKKQTQTIWTNTHQLIKRDLIWWKNNRIVVAGDNNLKRGVIYAFHDKPSTGHLGISNTYRLARRDTWWPNMKQDIEQYVKGCATCQASKVNTGPLKPA